MLRADESATGHPAVGRATGEHRAARGKRIPSHQHRTNPPRALAWTLAATKRLAWAEFRSLASNCWFTFVRHDQPPFRCWTQQLRSRAGVAMTRRLPLFSHLSTNSAKG